MDDPRPSAGAIARYRWLLKAFPSDFRDAYEADLVDAFRDRWRSAAPSGLVGMAGFWWTTASDSIRSGVAERWSRVTRASGPVPPRRPWSGRSSASLARLADTVWSELGLAARSLRRRPGYAAAVAGILGVSLAAATTLWGAVYHVAVAPLGIHEEHRVVRHWLRFERVGRMVDFALSDLLITELADRTRTLEAVGFVNVATSPAVLQPPDAPPERTPFTRVSTNFFDVLGVRAALGRTFSDGEDGADLAVISHGTWQRRYGGDRAILDRSVELGGRSVRIIGVLPASFRWLDFPERAIEFWVPQRLEPDRLDPFFFYGVARLQPGASILDAQEEAHRIFGDVIDRAGRGGFSTTDRWATVLPIRQVFLEPAGDQLRILVGAMFAVVLLGTVNVAVLVLIRTLSRGRESVVRIALGGGTGRVAAPVLAEIFLLVIAAGLLAAALVVWALGLIQAHGPTQMPRLDHARASWPVMLGGLGMASLAVLAVAGVAWLGTRGADPHAMLKATAGTMTSARMPRPLRGSLIVAQVLLSIVLLSVAARLGRSFTELRAVDPGFTTASIVQGNIGLPTEELWEPVPQIEGDILRVAPRMSEIRRELREKLAPHPQIVGVSLAQHAPLSGRYNAITPFVPEGWEGEEMPGGRRWITTNAVDPDFLPFLGVELLRGRWLSWEDDANGARVAIVSEALARAMWPEGDAVGSRFRNDRLVPDGQGGTRWQEDWRTVVGVVQTLREWSLREEDESVYTPLEQAYAPGSLVYRSSRGARLRVFVRYEGDAGAVVEHMRLVVSDVLRGVPLDDVRTLDEVARSWLREPRFYVGMFGAFSALALLLAGTGVAAVIGYSVSSRTREIGVRVALGAWSRELFDLVALETLVFVAIGVAAGVYTAWLTGTALESLLYEVSPQEPWSIVASAVLFAAVALVSAWTPVRTALRIDPASTLREE